MDSRELVLFIVQLRCQLRSGVFHLQRWSTGVSRVGRIVFMCVKNEACFSRIRESRGDGFQASASCFTHPPAAYPCNFPDTL